MTIGLTHNQERVLQVVIDPDLQRPPSFATIAQKAELKNRGSVGSTLKALKRKGYLDENLKPIVDLN